MTYPEIKSYVAKAAREGRASFVALPEECRQVIIDEMAKRELQYTEELQPRKIGAGLTGFRILGVDILFGSTKRVRLYR